jgi:hypothetical protein
VRRVGLSREERRTGRDGGEELGGRFSARFLAQETSKEPARRRRYGIAEVAGNGCGGWVEVLLGGFGEGDYRMAQAVGAFCCDVYRGAIGWQG